MGALITLAIDIVRDPERAVCLCVARCQTRRRGSTSEGVVQPDDGFRRGSSDHTVAVAIASEERSGGAGEVGIVRAVITYVTHTIFVTVFLLGILDQTAIVVDVVNAIAVCVLARACAAGGEDGSDF